MKLYTEKYAPKSRAELVGDASSFTLLHSFLAGKPIKGKKKGLWLVGPPGTGKTIAVTVIAEELGLELVEINASDVRNADSIEQVVGNAIKQQSLFSRGKVILIDEVDGLAGREDRGGVGAIATIIETSTFPVVLTSASADESKLSPLKKLCTLVPLDAHSAAQILAVLKKIATHEKISLEEEAMHLLSRKAAGDMRAALNDLQALSSSGLDVQKPLAIPDVELLGDRRRIETMQQALLKIFKSTDPMIVRGTYDTVEEDLEELFLWLDENIPVEYTRTEDRKRAFMALALADVFFGRIRRWQYYRFYVYCYELLSVGVALAKEKKYAPSITYQRTSRILKMWIVNQQQAKAKGIAKALAPHFHVSIKRMQREVLPYLRLVAAQQGYAQAWSENYRLDDEQRAWLAREA